MIKLARSWLAAGSAKGMFMVSMASRITCIDWMVLEKMISR